MRVCECVSVCVSIKSRSKNDSNVLWPAFNKLLHQKIEIEDAREVEATCLANKPVEASFL